MPVEFPIERVEPDSNAGLRDIERPHVADRPTEIAVVEGYGAEYLAWNQRVGGTVEASLLIEVSDRCCVAIVMKIALSDRDAVAGSADTAFGIYVIDSEFDATAVVTARGVEDYDIVRMPLS